MNDRSMGAEAWIFLLTLIGLALAYFAPIPTGAIRALGTLVAISGLGFGVRYIVGDNKGQDWRGSFLPSLLVLRA